MSQQLVPEVQSKVILCGFKVRYTTLELPAGWR